jgi:hypothetical protein
MLRFIGAKLENIMIKKILHITKPLRFWYDKITYQRSSNFEEIKKLCGEVKGKPLLIVGNGPSLNNTPLNKFNNVFSIGMNKIDMFFTKTAWRPNLILITNNLVVKQHWKSLVKNGIPSYLSWKTRYFIPNKVQDKFYFFLSSPSEKFQPDVSKSVGMAGTVTYTALQFAYYLGANPVILVGVDHSFTYEGNPNDIQKRKGKDLNHFDPNYFAAGQYWGVPNLSLSEVGYRNAREAFEKDGRDIYDATVGGKLEVFKKISIDDAVSIMTGNYICD